MVTSMTSSRDEAADSAHGTVAAAAADDEAESAAALLDSYRSLHLSVCISPCTSFPEEGPRIQTS